MAKEETIGGMAVIEGVMFKGGSTVSLAVRKSDGTIHTQSEQFQSYVERFGLKKVALVRGMVSFIDMMILGTKYLNKSADIALDDIDSDSKKKKTKKNSKIKTKKSQKSTLKSSTNTILLVFSFIIAIALAIGLFKLLPLFLAGLIVTPQDSPVLYATLEGLIKIILFVGYILIISQMTDIKRVFQYHGAEHKVIRCFEAKKSLTIENVKKSSRFHPRCGTSFLVFVIFVSIIVYLFIPVSWDFWTKLAVRLALLPIIAGISYEIIFLTAKISEKSWLRFLLFPGFCTQQLTTKEPDSKQIEVAIKSFVTCQKAMKK